MRTTIQIQGARENNLRNIDVEIPRDKLTVVTGMSGSGKSSLAFDTIYAEGQRRLLASMSTFAKRFVGQLKKLPSRAAAAGAQALAGSPHLAHLTALDLDYNKIGE